MTRPPGKAVRKMLCAVSAAAFGGALLTGTGTAQAGDSLPVDYSFLNGYLKGVGTPATPPPGANDFGCKPTARHPHPVVLAHGTAENMSDNWQAASSVLVDHGYCVFAFDYGGAKPSDAIQGLGPVAAGAAELSQFVDRVRAATGAAKVDIVGHSQGGMMPRYYMKFLDGADKVGTLVGIAPMNHGTTLDGVTVLGDLTGSRTAVNGLLDQPCAACVDQEVGSPFLTKLNQGGDTIPGVSYTVIETKEDETVTPYTSAFLSGPSVHNITTDDQCAFDKSDHLELSYDPVALADMLNALDPSHPVDVPCVPVAPMTGPVGPVPSF